MIITVYGKSMSLDEFTAKAKSPGLSTRKMGKLIEINKKIAALRVRTMTCKERLNQLCCPGS